MNALTNIFKYKEQYNVYGLTQELNFLYITNYFKNNEENVIVLTNTLYEANNFYKGIKTYEEGCLLFPMDDFLTSVAIAVSPDLKIKRLEVLDTLKKEQKKHIVVTSLMGYLKYLANIKEEQSILLKTDSKNISREIILNKLDKYGYRKESLVTTTGEYAVRGYIIDIFPISQNKPIRIEFFGEEVESIREFDENSQLTTKTIPECEIKKINEDETSSTSSLLDYMPKCSVFLIDETQIKTSYEKLLEDMYEYCISKDLPTNTKFMYNYDELKPNKLFKIDTLNLIPKKDSIKYDSKEVENFNSSFDKLKTFIKKEIKDKKIIFILNKDNQIDKIREEFEEYDVIINPKEAQNNRINVIKGNLNKGFEINNTIYISPNDIDHTNEKKIEYKNTIKIGRKVKSFTDLKIGDYIVHASYGIGKYAGLKTLKTSGYEKDYICLEYLGSDKVYVPVENIDRIYKYSDAEGKEPNLDKLNSGSWAKRKLATKNKIKDISEELLKLYCARQTLTTTPYKDFTEEEPFALNIPFTLTDDQEKTINEINDDLKSVVPMDRLLCGDVGYGKTEVAFRAIFKTVLNGFQVAYLCPTTILSRQQYLNALNRFKDYGVNIELLNRHTKQSEVKRIFKGLEEGTVDIVFGTHKLLNDKIMYKKLGLLIIDEEQRFGVSHKEKIKEIKNDVNVLTLSATPIPRTLKMAMSGLRSLSILDTPPVNRYPIQTYVIEESELIIRESIYKELSRDGQVYFLINNIDELDKYSEKIRKLVPEAKIVTAHGRMNSDEINNIMEAFIDRKYDVLVCTTIIETGIDISNVNTIIIIDADRFGLSQLYQIRGRVGRSDKIAYSYLMYNKNKILTETSIKRLNSIKEFTELGSGYKIAMRDLSIRGSGDLLGSSQAGFIDAVGIDLYTRMVNDEVKRLRGEQVEEDVDEKGSILSIDTHIDDNYVDDEDIKIEIHKLINTIKNKKDYLSVKKEIENRFGKVNEKLEIYMLEKCSESLIKKLNITRIIQDTRKITIFLPEEISNNINGEKLFMDICSINPKFNISYRSKQISISLITDNLNKNYVYYIYDLLDCINKQIYKV